MTTRVRILGVTAALVATAALGSTAGIAKTGHLGARAAPGAGKQAPDVQAAAPSGYVVVTAVNSAPNGQDTSVGVTCPATKKGAARYPLGGGVLIGSGSLSANVNSSFPVPASSWAADVNNNSGADTTFTVYAICATPPKNYQVVHASAVTLPPGAQITDIAACPSGTKVTGGGGVISSSNLAVNLNTSVPTGNGWRIDVNNASASDDTVTSYAVCSARWGASTGYHVAIGSAVNNPAGTETQATVSCPSGQSVLGGGGYSGSASTAVNMNSTYPITSGWGVLENNASGKDTTITAYAICAT